MEDSEIIKLFFERSESAVRESVNKYGALCRKVAGGILDDHHDIEECVNDTMMTAWSEIPPKEPLFLGAFLAKLSRNISVSMFRKKTASKRFSNEAALCIDELEACIPDSNTGDIQEQIEIRDLLNRFLGSLDTRARVIFMRRYWFTYSDEQIASELSMSIGAVKMSLNRTRKKLKKQFESEAVAYEKRGISIREARRS
ncbi:MAG: sigma-70 family RNA polymerase sigma factor [Oscillospiraceae bacterium]|nr:sigma-70 family RNA polymerase sigma factor [Oscillospiraceae bacterium]